MLDVNHPGFGDLEYRRRRDQIAEYATSYVYPDVAPRVCYDVKEHEVWRIVNRLLRPIHAARATRLYKHMWDVAALGVNEIPQLEDINGRLERTTGFQLIPIEGLVSPRAFLSALSDRRMLCTQYIRHHSAPLYTPEPDIVHELIGHVVMFFDTDYCSLNAEIGAAAKVLSEASLVKLARLYWYSIEFGLVAEEGFSRAFGAGLLSSPGELDAIDSVAHVPFCAEDIVQMPYDTMHMQHTLFKASSIREMYTEIREYIRKLRRCENV